MIKLSPPGRNHVSAPFWLLLSGGTIGLLSGGILPSYFSTDSAVSTGAIRSEILLVAACYGIQLVAILVLGVVVRRILAACLLAAVTMLVMLVAPLATWFAFPPGASAAVGVILLSLLASRKVSPSVRYFPSIYGYLVLVIGLETCINLLIVSRWPSSELAASICNVVLAFGFAVWLIMNNVELKVPNSSAEPRKEHRVT